MAVLTPLQQAYLTLKKTEQKLIRLEKMQAGPIAIIGMACRFPGHSAHLDAFWQLLHAGKNAIVTVPNERWQLKDYPNFASLLNENFPGRYGGFLSEPVDEFDAAFFSLNPREVQSMDPQQRLLLETAWSALEQANIVPASLAGSKTGVFVGEFTHDYEDLLVRQDNPESIDAYFATGNSACVSAGRISYFLDLHGPCLTLDTACSSSLVAIHEACLSLRLGESDLALAGGVNLILSPLLSLNFARAGMLAPDGRCKTFDANADGYGRGEGCGIVVLKRLADAERDRDTVLAVICSTAVNQDGMSSGLTVPNSLAQQKLLQAALQSAQLQPEAIDYIEAHGTGTKLGDPIEMRAITTVFAGSHTPARPLIIGSVKTNIGHLEAAAGIASVIKVVLALQHQEIPPHINLAQSNPLMDLSTVPVQINRQPISWPYNADHTRRAGISSFGFSGTNAHLILEEAPSVKVATAQARPAYLITLSAQHVDALQQRATDLRGWLSLHPDTQLPALAYTLNARRTQFRHRFALVVASLQELIQKLEQTNIAASREKHLPANKVNVDKEQQQLQSLIQEPSLYHKQLEVLAELYREGQDLDWDIIHAENVDQTTLSLPTYPFLKNHYWFKKAPSIAPTGKSMNTDKDRGKDKNKNIKHENVLAKIQEIIAKHLYLELSEIEVDQPWASYGIDSILVVEIIKDINSLYNLQLTATTLYAYTTPHALADYLASLETENFQAENLVAEKSGEKQATEDIAIIGMAAHLPGARTITELWENIAAGRSAIQEIPAERWSIADYYSPDQTLAEKSYCKWGGFIDGVKEFDPLFFNISPSEAENMDPQQRMVLQLSWQALEDAGYAPDSLSNFACGIYVGVMNNDYDDLILRAKATPAAQQLVGNSNSILAARAAYFLNLKSAAIALDTACSSSLVAIHLACEALNKGEASLMLAGGVTLYLIETPYVRMSRAGMLSATGACKTFDNSADGFVPGEGCAMVVLKRLQDALRDKDLIYGVIRASGINQDGKTNGITAPSAEAQKRLELKIYEQHGIDPADISYVEAHGTGTKLGDPIEMEALSAAFANFTQKKQYCGIGAIKSNIGHTSAAAGVASVIKVLLCLQHQQLVPSIHYQNPNEHIDFTNSPFYVTTTLQPWQRIDNKLRLAAVSSFGFSGTNAHLVIGEIQQQPVVAMANKPYYLLTISAKHPDVLQQKLRDLQNWADVNPDASLPAIAYTLNICRSHFNYRCAMVVATTEQLRETLKQLQQGKTPDNYRIATVTAKSQQAMTGFKNTGKEQLLALANLYVQGHQPDWALLHAGEGIQKIRLPVYPFLREQYWIVSGWNASLTGAEFYLSDHVVQGKKILPAAAYLEMARAAGEVAMPGQQVREIKQAVWLQPLSVDGSPVRINIRFSPEGTAANYKVTSGTTGKEILHSQGELNFATEIGAAVAWGKLSEITTQMTQEISAHDLYANFKSQGLSYGPSFQVLTVIKTNGQAVLAQYKLPLASKQGTENYKLHPSILDGALQAIAALRLNTGLSLPFMIERLRIYHALPAIGYIYGRPAKESSPQQPKYDLQIWDINGDVCAEVFGFNLRAVATIKYYIPQWRPQALSSATSTASIKSLWILSDDAALLSIFRTALPNMPVVQLQSGDSFSAIDPYTYRVRIGTAEDYAAVLQATLASAFTPSHFMLARSSLTANTAEGAIDYIEHDMRETVVLLQTLMQHKTSGELRFVALYNANEQNAFPFARMLDGFGKSVRQEHSQYQLHVVGINPEQLAVQSIAELTTADANFSVRYSGNQREVEQYVPIDLVTAPIPLRSNGVYLITGGLGGLGYLFASHLAEKYQAKLILTGRTALDDAKKSQLKHLESLGAEAIYLTGDVANYGIVKAWIAEIKKRFGAIHGILHCAGQIQDALLLHKDWKTFQQIVTPKVQGALNLDTATLTEPLECFVLFSSIASVVGNVGQTDYASANAWLDTFAGWRAHQVQQGERSGKTLAINWPLWAEGGMQVQDATREYFSKQGLQLLTNVMGWQAFTVLLQQPYAQCLVIYGDPALWQRRMNEVIVSRPAVAISADSTTVVEKLHEDLRAAISQTLKLPIQAIDLQEDLSHYGFDSISFTVLANQLKQTFQVAVTPALFFEYPTITKFADYLWSAYQAQLSEYYAASVQQPSITEKISTVSTEKTSKEIREDIAIIGMAGVLPQAPTLDKLWELLLQGSDLISEIPKERWDTSKYEIPGFIIPKWSGLITDIDKFDAEFFAISPREADFMDPQQRILLETVWHTIEDAGYPITALATIRTGLFVGISTYDYAELSNDNEAKEAHSATGIAHSIAANRISFLLNLTGPSMALDTACSSSLVALHQAVRAIQAGDCELAIVAGVNALLSPRGYLSFARAGMLAPDGRCKTFDKAANGYGRGEGVGAVLLKPLTKALQDHDRVLAVIKATNVNHGGHVNTLTAPNPNAHAELITRAYQKANVSPDTISYIEAHGTGTPLGDPIEVNGLKRAFAQLAEYFKLKLPEAYCGLGTIKANIGHLESAAGIAGIMKALLMLQHNKIPPQANFKELNPYIELANSPFYITTRIVDWNPSTAPRRIGISSFGFGGTNAHVVLQGPALTQRPVSPEKPFYLLTLSAKTREALMQRVIDLRDWLSTHSATPLADIAYTLNARRDHFNYRFAAVVANVGELQEKLKQIDFSQIEPISDEKLMNDPAVQLAFLEIKNDVMGEKFLENLLRLASLYVKGQNIDWEKLQGTEQHQTVSLPGYPFMHKRYWYNVHTPQVASVVSAPSVPPAPAQPSPQPKVNLVQLKEIVSEGPEEKVQEKPNAAPEMGTITEALQQLLIRHLYLEQATIEPEKSWADYGMDSILALEIIKDIEKVFSIKIAVTKIYEFPTLKTMAAHIAALVEKKKQITGETKITIFNNDIEIIRKGNGEPLLLLPPGNMLFTSWVKQFDGLSDNFDVISFNYPGIGGSSFAPYYLRFNKLAELVLELLRKLRISQRVNLVGWSQGSVLARAIAVKYPELLKTLILVSPLQENITQLDIPACVAELDQDFKSHLAAHPDTDIIFDHMKAKFVDANVAYFKEICRFDYLNLPRQITTPTLVIAGSEDKICSPEYAKKLVERVPHAQYKEIEGAGHFIPLFNSEAFNKIVSDFIRSLI